MAAPFTTFPIQTTFAVSEWGLPVNVKDFGAVGDGTADDTTSIQAAIDYAVTNSKQTIYMPAGTYKITAPIWLDPFTNMRGGGANPTSPPAGSHPPNFANPTNFAFSLSLIGDFGMGHHEGGMGTHIVSTFNNDIAVVVGPGQGMRVAYLSIVGPFGQYRAMQNSNGCGLGICGGNGGVYRCEIESVWVENFYTCFSTGANGNGALDDSNIFRNCVATNGARGVCIAQSQNFTNTFYHCNIGCQIGLLSGVGAGGHIFGGNWSAVSAQSGAFGISGITALVSSIAPNYFDYTFTAIIASPDQYVFTEVYESWAIQTAHFGIIPMSLTAYNSGTQVGTFKIETWWSQYYYYNFDAAAGTQLSADIQACTFAYASERVHTLQGTGISMRGGVHIENPAAPWCLIDNSEGIGSNPPDTIEDLTCNWEPSLVDFKTAGVGTANYGKWLIQSSWPFIDVRGPTNLAIKRCNFEMLSGNPLLIRWNQSRGQLTMEENFQFGPIHSICPPDNRVVPHPQFGGGYFDSSPYGVTGFNNRDLPGVSWRKKPYWGNAPVWGYMPAAYTRPAIDSASTTALTTSPLPPIEYDGAGTYSVTYPLLWGGQIYSVFDPFMATNQNYEIISKHNFYTYGQDLTNAMTGFGGLSWSYKGGSMCVYLDAATLGIIFPGLAVILFDGAVDRQYVITAVHPGLGYFTVRGGAAYGDAGTLSGAIATVFTGTTIKQPPYSIQVVTGPNTATTETGNFTVGVLENNIIVNKGSTCTVTLPSASIYKGRTITIKTIQAFTVVSNASNVIPQAGGGAGTAILAATAGKWAQLVANGTNWEITQSN